jgi:macrodomain Ter protein organizer (MatP/YcbG family)
MDENSDTLKSSISQADTAEGIADFWDSHSLEDHWDQTHEVEFEVRAQRPRRITIDPEIYERLEQQARTRGVTLETLVNQWLSEHLSTDKAA